MAWVVGRLTDGDAEVHAVVAVVGPSAFGFVEAERGAAVDGVSAERRGCRDVALPSSSTSLSEYSGLCETGLRPPAACAFAPPLPLLPLLLLLISVLR